MMYMFKRGILGLLIVIFLVLSAFCVNADTLNDISDDVYHYNFSETGWSWEKSVSEKPNIDIVEISNSVVNEEVILKLKVKGNIASSENIIYWTYYNSSDSAYYFSWSNGEGFGIAVSLDETSGSYDFEPDISASGDTITAVFDVIGTTDSVALWGWAAEYSVINDQSSEWWGDWAPTEYSPFWNEDTGDDNGEDDDSDGDDVNESDMQDGTGDEGDSDSGTPGFEFLFLMIAIGAIFILVRKYR